ncbi:MAG: hypothetical protein RLZ44_913 [Pseudomonadota bacterium]|jgi:hypothetical protein
MMKGSTLGMLALGLVLAFVDYQPGSGIEGLSLVKQAHAIVGRPLTPISVAGVARRTTRRMIYATNVYVATLPANCSVVVVEGTTLHLCGTTYYKPSGTQYVVVNVQ